MEGDEGLSAFHPFSEEKCIFGTAGEIISMHSKTDLHIWRGSVFAWEMYEGVFLLFSFDCLFSFFQPVHEKRGERGKDAEGDEYPADGGGELLRRPLSPIGPKIRARTTAAVFNPSFLIR